MHTKGFKFYLADIGVWLTYQLRHLRQLLSLMRKIPFVVSDDYVRNILVLERDIGQSSYPRNYASLNQCLIVSSSAPQQDSCYLIPHASFRL
jgi:hypothetical protein